MAKSTPKKTRANRPATAAKRGQTKRPPRARRSGNVPDTADHPSSITIVGVGASAGGLEAFSALLRGLPAAPGLAIVFVQHLAPSHDSALVTLLSTQTSLPIVQAVDGMHVEADHVYVIPPNVQMA